MNPCEHVTISASGHVDEEAFATALQWAIDLANEEAPHVLLVVSSNQQLGNAAEYLGQPSKDFTWQGTHFHVRTLKDLPQRAEMPVIALWIVDKSLPAVEKLQPTGLCSIPWVETDNEKWRAARSPRDLLGSVSSEPVGIDRPIVAAAMRWLAHRDGVRRSEDRSFAVRVFQRLDEAREVWKPQELRAWIVANGWEAKDADELEYIARATLDGSRLKAPHCARLPADTLDRWRSEAHAQTGGGRGVTASRHH